MEQAAARLLHQRAKRVFLRAVDASPERRRRLIEEACADDPALRAEVERLLANAHSDTADLSRSSYLASPPKPEVRFEANARVGDRYRIERRIGSGGMADVYLAFDELLDQRVALKFPTRGALAATGELDGLLREARAAREVIHPNVCRVFDAGVFEKEPFLSLEFVEGENLGHRIAREGPLPREE
ncbi:MAG: hypothetical protein MPN21_01520, partial [Thermoanaerobaculia bacterium]|nr:hypothetical protein [Thermoanaerobaculia bacterium]